MKNKAVSDICHAKYLVETFLHEGSDVLDEQTKDKIKEALESPELKGFDSPHSFNCQKHEVIQAADKMIDILQSLSAVKINGEIQIPRNPFNDLFKSEALRLQNPLDGLLQEANFCTIMAKFEMDDMTNIPAFMFNEWLTDMGGSMLAEILHSERFFINPFSVYDEEDKEKLRQSPIYQRFEQFREMAINGAPFEERKVFLKETAELIRDNKLGRSQRASERCSEELMKIATSMYPSVPVRRLSKPR